MVLTNHMTARWFDGDSALFMTHSGFKGERNSELKGLLRDYCPTVSELDATQLVEFRQIIRHAHEVEDFPLSTLLTKRFDRGMWQLSRAEHFGLGLDCYTTVTSPIRKYSDLVMHRLIKLKLADQPLSLSEELVSYLNDYGNLTRNIANTIDKRLGQQWLQKQPKQAWNVKVNHLNASGLVVQIIDNGITGFLDLKRTSKEKFSYDPLRMMLKTDELEYKLNDELTVEIAQIDDQGIAFKLAETEQ
jgi:exoribonuclease R